MTFFYLNARSICKKGKLDELECIIRAIPKTVHIIILSETWIQNENQAARLALPNYTHYFNFRTDTTGGGVSAYVHNNLKHSLSESSYTDGNNYLWIRLQNYALEIGIIYKPGDTNFQKFIEVYNSQLNQRPRTVIFGDFNIDLRTRDKYSRTYKEVLSETGHFVLNKISKKYHTRGSQTKKSILDHVCTNLKSNSFHIALIESSMSDHRQIYVELKEIKPVSKIIHKYEAIDYNKLYSDANEHGFEELRDDYTILENRIKNYIQKSKIPKKKILNMPQKDWINSSIIQGINRRNSLWAELKKNPENASTKEMYFTAKNQICKQIKETKENYFYKEFTNCAHKPKKMWNLINNLASNKIKQICAPSKLIVDSIEITDAKLIAENFNKYFSSIGKQLADQIPRIYHDNYTNALPETNYNSKLETLTPCSPDEIIKIIKNLDSNASTGIDGISTKAVKCISHLIANNLSICFNKLLSEGIFPQTLKIAKVMPIFKSGPKTEPGNYRPISVLPIMSKILEKILFSRLEEYLNSINFLYDHQYGFRPKSNTLSSTIDLVTKIRMNIDSKNVVLGIFIDLKKAFDTVSHQLLIKKLERIGIGGQALKMIESYLKDRSQVVKFENDIQSQALPVTCGVPQGSILGPLLFLTYINNLQEIGLCGDVTLYADDTCLFYYGSNILDLFKKAQKDLDRLYSWFQYNLLTVNISKTCYVIFKAKSKPLPTYPQLKIDNIPLQEKDCEKYLGLRLDSRLSWNTQIEHVRTKLMSLMASLKNITRCIPRQIRFTIYNCLVKPHLLYLIEVWGSGPKTKLAELQIAQNKIIKILFHYNYLTSTAKIYEETKIMTVKQLYVYCTCILVRKILTSSLHTNLTLTKVKQVNKRSTRRASFIVTPKIRTNYGRKMFTYEGAQLYNLLPPDIKSETSFRLFKSKLAEYVVERYFLSV